MTAYGEKTLIRSHDARLASLGTMASGVAHEINTPIQFIGDNLQFIRDSFASIDDLLRRYAKLHIAALEAGVLTVEARDVTDVLRDVELDFVREELPSAIEQSLAGVQQVARIASAMKTFARRGMAEKELTDINQSIEMTVTICRNEWKYDCDLELSLDPSLPLVSCYVGELSQVWLNLIVNAVHAIKAKPDLSRGLITIATSERDGVVEVGVTDNGIGIPGEVRDRVFEPFFSTKEADAGSGQGLAISQAIVAERHGGDIAFRTSAGEGTCFTVRLPLSTETGSASRQQEVVP